ncbi:class I SAM-dependent methyltransferase [Sphingomonas agri]|uniref:class I SAM-dependent methyltransferase n=1 Tax=Sphingomonas agri TaxID=1813878 RepID=UPI00311D60E2
MRLTRFAAVTLAIAAVPVGAGAAAPASPSIAAAAASASRSPGNVKLDAGRKPVQVLQFLGLRRGMNVLDLFGANAYWAEITSPVVGTKGHVTVWNPTQFYSDKTKQAFETFRASHPNVSIVTSAFEAPDLPRNFADLVILNDNYHDNYWQNEKLKVPRMDPDAFLKAVYSSMKPGGVIGVIDHVANPNPDTRATVEKYHRIDPNVVKADFKRAGFVLVGSSNILRNPADRHDIEVHDPKIAGKTDRFVFKFKKPR